MYETKQSTVEFTIVIYNPFHLLLRLTREWAEGTDRGQRLKEMTAQWWVLRIDTGPRR